MMMIWMMIWIWQQDDYSNEHPIHLDMKMIAAVAVVDIAEVAEEAMNDDDDVDCEVEGVGN